MKLDQSPVQAGGTFIAPATRAFYTWDVSTGDLHWGGNCIPILNCAPWDMPATINGWMSVIHPDDRQLVQDALRGLLGDRQPIRFEFRVRRPDGRIVAVAEHAAFVSDNTVIGSVARASAGSRLWEPAFPQLDESTSENGRPDSELVRFFDLSEDLMCIAGIDGFFRRVNPNFSRVLGYSLTELLSRPFLDFVHPEDQDATRAAMARLSQGLPVAQFRNRYRTARGGVRWLEWTARSLPNEGVVFAVARDVTEQVELERRLRAQEARERAILNNATAVIYVKNRNGEYEFVNDQYIRLFDLFRAGVLGKTDSQIFPLPFARAFQANDQQVLETGETIQVEEAIPHPDGIHTYVSVKFPLFDADGRVSAVAGISTDITDRVRAQEADEQLRTARQVQQKLYPAAPPSIPGFDVACRGVSASQLCGDYFDFIPRGQRLVAAVGDVCGHGLGPALTMVETRATLRLLLQSPLSLDEVLSRLNHQLFHETGDSLFVSLFLAELDLETREVSFAGAGHVAYLLRADGRDERLPSTGPLLGLSEAVEFESDTTPPLMPGDTLVLITDGLVETMTPEGEQFGTQRVLQLIRQNLSRPAAEIINRLFSAVSAFSEGQPFKDDMTVILIKAR